MMMEKDGEKLRTLLSYLISHNRDHSSELRELVDKVEGVAGESVQNHLLEAAQLMDKPTESLTRTLSKLSEG